MGLKVAKKYWTGSDKTDSVAGTYVIGSGTKLRLECGESAIELNASGQINLVGTGFSMFVNGEGYITASGKNYISIQR